MGIPPTKDVPDIAYNSRKLRNLPKLTLQLRGRSDEPTWEVSCVLHNIPVVQSSGPSYYISIWWNVDVADGYSDGLVGAQWL